MSLRHGLSGFIIRRLLLGLVTLWITSVIIFAATQALPGDAARSILGRSATPESLAELRAQLGLDKPVLTQYWEWICGFFTGDLGTSLANSLPVTDVIGERLVYTFFLMLIAGAISVPLGIALGAISARRRDCAFDQATSVATLGLAALPEFVVGDHARRDLLDYRLPRPPERDRDRARLETMGVPEGARPPGHHADHRRRPVHGADHASVDRRDPRERLRRDGAGSRGSPSGASSGATPSRTPSLPRSRSPP